LNSQSMPKLPGINHKDAIRVLEKLGWTVVREGKHTIMGLDRRAMPIPRHNPIHAITMGNIAKAAGLTPDQFRALL
jgi:predicted RNA binding protein YcfA (HicA-like mRNA interferase family)